MNPILKAKDTIWWYKPSTVDLEKVKIKDGAFLLSGDWVFHTIQWEWNWAWVPTTFVRLHICNLSCSFCDTWYTWKRDEKAFYDEPYTVYTEELEPLVRMAQDKAWVERYIKNVTFTWGEPLLHQKQIEDFMRLHPEYTVQIETNWTIAPSSFLLKNAKFNCSPKLASSWHISRVALKEAVLKAIAQANAENCFKFVCSEDYDVLDVVDFYSWIIPLSQIYIMPEWVTKEENYSVFERIMPVILAKGLKVSFRGQNIMFDGAKRWV